jgi:beta-glucanase (GH16 family)
VISGTPTTAVAGAFSVVVTDATATNVYANLALTINATGTSWQLAWSDEFNGSGSPNSSDWGYEIGQIRNGEPQYFTSRVENVRQENGALIIEGRKESYNGASYTSASVLTQGKRSFLYGRIEVRAKLPAGRGPWPAIWMQGTSGSWPARGEIDIMENVGFEPTVTHSNVWTPNFQSAQYFSTNPVGDITQWHIYALEWYVDRLDFFVDGVKVNTFPNLGGTSNWPFSQPQYLILGMAIGGSWGGQQGIDDSIFPAQYSIDYVRYYTKQ